MKQFKYHLELYFIIGFIAALIGYGIGSAHGYWEGVNDLCDGTQILVNGKPSCNLNGNLIFTGTKEDMVFELPILYNDT